MKHIGTRRLETERLVLRRFRPEDAAAMYNNWACDSEVTKYLTWPTHSGVEVTESLLKEWDKSYADDRYYTWAIVPKDNDDAPIGSISAVELNDALSLVQIGYCIGRRWWHRGLTSEALQAVMDFFFDEVGANRVEAKHDTNNPRSGMVMRKCGMKYEGTHRSAARNNQGVCDVSVYALLRADR